jgi:hypothetical protein
MAASIEYPLDPKSPNCVSVLHLSDLHFPSERAVDDPQGFWRHFANVLAEREELRTGIDLIAVTGDLLESCEWKKNHQLRTLGKVKEKLRGLCANCNLDPATRLFVIPGNHDYKWKGLIWSDHGRQSFDNAFSDYAHDRLFVMPDGWHLFVGCFDSNLVDGISDLARGEVDPAEITSRLLEHGKNMSHAGNLTKLALVHHHPLPVATSENLAPEGMVEGWTGKKLVGAPEHMIFRNAGMFLETLLQHDFRAVLHGHLHYRGYFRVARSIGAREQMLEVFSGASLGAPPRNGRHGFHLLKIRRDGTLDSKHYEFEAHGKSHEPVVVETADYGTIRLRNCWSSAQPKDVEATCDLHQKLWEVRLPEGDVATIDVFHGLRSIDQPLSFVTLPVRSETVAARNIEAFVEGSPGRVSIDQDAAMADGSKQYNYRLCFKPPLDNDPIKVVVHRTAEGALLATAQQQERMQVPDSRMGWESCNQLVRFATEKLHMTLRFVPEGLTPASVHLVVLEPTQEELTDPAQAAKPVEHASEGMSQSVIFTKWQPLSAPKGIDIEVHPVLEATCAVTRPLLGHRYCFRWYLPELDPIDDIAKQLNILAKMLGIKDSDPGARSLLQSCVETARETIAAADHAADAADSELHAGLFALDDRRGKTVCVAASAPGCLLRTLEPHWGRDIIGEVARRGAARSLYRKQGAGNVRRIEKLPPSVECLLAFPVYCYDPDGFPAGVIAVASTSKSTGLYALRKPMPDSEEGDMLWEEELCVRLHVLWQGVFPALLGIPQSPPKT